MTSPYGLNILEWDEKPNKQTNIVCLFGGFFHQTSEVFPCITLTGEGLQLTNSLISDMTIEQSRFVSVLTSTVTQDIRL